MIPPLVAEVRLWRRLERVQRHAVVAVDQRGLAVRGQPVAAAATAVVRRRVAASRPVVAAADLAVSPALVVLQVQHGHLHGLAATPDRRAPVRLLQRRYPQTVRRVHADVRAGHAVRVLHVVVVVVHFQVGRVVAAVDAGVRAARQRVRRSATAARAQPRRRRRSRSAAAVVQRGRRLVQGRLRRRKQNGRLETDRQIMD